MSSHLLFVKVFPEGTEWENNVSFMLVTGLGGLKQGKIAKHILFVFNKPSATVFTQRLMIFLLTVNGQQISSAINNQSLQTKGLFVSFKNGIKSHNRNEIDEHQVFNMS